MLFSNWYCYELKIINDKEILNDINCWMILI